MKRITLIVICFLFLFAGCQQQPETPTEVTGREGVVLSITDEPREVFEGEEFSITYSLENKGATKISEDSVQGPGLLLFSVDKLYLQEVDRVDRYEDSAFWLEPRTLFAQGETGFVTAYFRARNIDRFSESVNTAVVASMCYPYNSSVTTQVCIEATRDADSGSIACRSTPVIPSTPAAPVGVDKITVSTGRGPGGQVLPQFRIHVRNYDSGVPATSMCDPLESSQGLGLNEVFVSAKLLDEELICEGSGKDGAVRLRNGDGLVTCSVPGTASLRFGETSANYLSLLTVNIDYTYRDSQRTDLRIVR
jgi:hypothetical protein